MWLFYVLEQGKIILFSWNNVIVTCLWVGVKGGGGAGGWQDNVLLLMIFCSKFHHCEVAAYLFLMEQLASKHGDVYGDEGSSRKTEAVKSHSLRVVSGWLAQLGASWGRRCRIRETQGILGKALNFASPMAIGGLSCCLRSAGAKRFTDQAFISPFEEKRCVMVSWIRMAAPIWI